jgi:outer membrane protein TolC
MENQEPSMQHKDPSRRRTWPTWCLGCVWLAAGCHSLPPAETIQHSREPEIIRTSHRTSAPEFLPSAETKSRQPVPICLDTVLRLAQDQNGQVRLARMKLDDAATDQQWASKRWLPDLSVGIGAYRHDGGIQDFQGNLIRSNYGSTLAGLEVTGKYDWKEVLFRRVEAERRVWQQKGELSKLTSENLLEASTTYVGLLAARSGIAVSLDTEIRLNDLLKQANDLAEIDNGLRVEVSRIQTELMAQTVLTVKLREASKAASAKLAYLLGLDPCCELLIADGRLAPIALVDAGQPVHQLVDQALSRGPGVRELEGLLRTVEAARNTNYGLTHWMPSVEVNLTEGGFGASPIGQPYDWANRFDAGVHMKWNLSEFVYAKQRRHQADANIQQVRLTFEDLRSKLTLGVQEARDAIHSGIEQVSLAEKHIRFAEESYKLSDQRLKQNIKGRSSSEVLLALRTLGGARLEYLQAVRDLNRAQLRLFVLVGASEAECMRYEGPAPKAERPRHLPRP